MNLLKTKTVCAIKKPRSLDYSFECHTPPDRPKDGTRQNDCTIRALATVAAIEYSLAEYIGQLAGRKDLKRGMISATLLKTATDEGFIFKRLDRPHISLARFLKEFSKGRYYIYKKGHAMAVVDGVLKDTARTKGGSHILGAWEYVGIKQ